MPKVSIITPCYNSKAYIGRTIDSVRAQTLSDWEHIVVDDGSTDGSAAVVQAYKEQEPRLRLVQQPNGGVSRARNRGDAASSPDSNCLLFLDADDCLEPTMLETMTTYLDQHSEVGLAYCDHAFVDAEDQVLDKQVPQLAWTPRYVPAGLWVKEIAPEQPETPFMSVFALAGIVPSMSILRRSVYAQTPGWDEDFGHLCEDTDVFLHMALRGEVHFVPQTLVRYRKHPSQATGSLEKLYKQEQKLYAKWNAGVYLTPSQRAVVAEAWRFRQSRLAAYHGLNAGRRHLRQGEIGKALRFVGGGARRYFLPADRV